eukprot:TRINITY_DN32_c0_g1_i3.p1 TRINITY_DN32_c0_g1~~TRINITY_DN32_c0_g1_i3.p1  ORF type:complete len:355 (-),score=104.65 TRINITY_DN32_c0_g1_i3:85-1116(-)
MDGVVSGSQNMIGALVLETHDGGLNWTVQYKHESLEMFMCLAFSDNHLDGVTAGLGMDVAEKSSIYTSDAGETWADTNDDNILATYQDCEHVPGSPEMFVMPGYWKHALIGKYGEGIAVSSDGGVNFAHYDWGMNTEARYTYWANSKVGWISGGTWPASSIDSNYNVRISQHVGLRGGRPEYISGGRAGGVGIDGYIGVIAKTVDGGQTWKLQLNDTGRLYFNALYAVNENEVWVVGEGDAGAWIIKTSDGGVTWVDQYFEAGASMLTIRMFDNMEGWVGGMAGGGVGLDGGVWHTLDGGKTWHEEELKGYYVNELDLLDRDHVYATAFDRAGVTAILAYLPV